MLTVVTQSVFNMQISLNVRKFFVHSFNSFVFPQINCTEDITQLQEDMYFILEWQEE